MKSYVNMNAEKRAETTNKFDADFYKLSVNSLFSKTIENPEKHTKVKLCRTKSELEKRVRHYSFKRSKIINRNLLGVKMKNSLVKMNKPFYVGNAVLELSKFHMYNFHYNVMKPVFNDRIQLLYTDTDSLMYEIESGDLYAELGVAGKKGWFDFSNFPPPITLCMTIVINTSLACSKTSAMFGPSGNLWACEARCTLYP